MFDLIRKHLNKIPHFDPILLLLTFLLLGIGITFIYGAGQHAGGDIVAYWWKQLLWTSIGLSGMFVCGMIDYKELGKWSPVIYIAGLSLLVIVLIFGTKINGARSWLPLGGITLQPSELAKPCTLLILAWYFDNHEKQPPVITKFIIPGLLFGLPFGLILLQPDLGSGFVLAPIFATLCFIAGIHKRWIFLAIFAVVVSAYPVYKYALKDYQRQRLQTLIDPSADIQGAGWNARQSLLAVGSGGLTGKGLGKGTQYSLGYLPPTVSTTDFIHSVIGEETGFIGSAALISIYLLLILRSVHIATKSSDTLGKFLALGVAAFIVTHCYINIGMTIGVAPIIGLPLPFVSYGGSFMLGCMLFMGLLQSVYIHNKKTKKPSLP